MFNLGWMTHVHACQRVYTGCSNPPFPVDDVPFTFFSTKYVNIATCLTKHVNTAGLAEYVNNT